MNSYLKKIFTSVFFFVSFLATDVDTVLHRKLTQDRFVTSLFHVSSIGEGPELRYPKGVINKDNPIIELFLKKNTSIYSAHFFSVIDPLCLELFKPEQFIFLSIKESVEDFKRIFAEDIKTFNPDSPMIDLIEKFPDLINTEELQDLFVPYRFNFNFGALKKPDDFKIKSFKFLKDMAIKMRVNFGNFTSLTWNSGATITHFDGLFVLENLEKFKNVYAKELKKYSDLCGLETLVQYFPELFKLKEYQDLLDLYAHRLDVKNIKDVKNFKIVSASFYNKMTKEAKKTLREKNPEAFDFPEYQALFEAEKKIEMRKNIMFYSFVTVGFLALFSKEIYNFFKKKKKQPLKNKAVLPVAPLASFRSISSPLALSK